MLILLHCQSFIRHAYGVYYTSMNWNLDIYAERLKDMSTRIPLRQLMITVLLVLMLSILSACADGEAHLTVNMDGSTDLDLNLNVTNSALGKIGQDNLMPLIADALNRNNFQAEVSEQGDQKQLTATTHYEKTIRPALIRPSYPKASRLNNPLQLASSLPKCISQQKPISWSPCRMVRSKTKLTRCLAF